jgi:hypothetical protein
VQDVLDHTSLAAPGVDNGAAVMVAEPEIESGTGEAAKIPEVVGTEEETRDAAKAAAEVVELLPCVDFVDSICDPTDASEIVKAPLVSDAVPSAAVAFAADVLGVPVMVAAADAARFVPLIEAVVVGTTSAPLAAVLPVADTVPARVELVLFTTAASPEVNVIDVLEVSVAAEAATAPCALVAAAWLIGTGVALPLVLEADVRFATKAPCALVAVTVVELVFKVSACATDACVTLAVVGDTEALAFRATVSATGAELNALRAA